MGDLSKPLALGLILRRGLGLGVSAQQCEAEVRLFTIRSTPAYVGEGDRRRIAERFIRPLTEGALVDTTSHRSKRLEQSGVRRMSYRRSGACRPVIPTHAVHRMTLAVSESQGLE